MPQVKTAPDDELVRRLVPGKVRVTISVYDTEGIPRSYRFVPGHSEIRRGPESARVPATVAGAEGGNGRAEGMA